MKAIHFPAILGLLLLLGACRGGGAGEESSEPSIRQEDKVIYVDPTNLQPGPAKTIELTELQKSQIKEIHEALSEVDPSAYEQKLEDFSRDSHVDREIAIWLEIARCYQLFEEDYPEAKLPQKGEAYSLLLYRSLMPTDEVLREQKLAHFSEGEARKILDAFQMSATPITVVETEEE